MYPAGIFIPPLRQLHFAKASWSYIGLRVALRVFLSKKGNLVFLFGKKKMKGEKMTFPALIEKTMVLIDGAILFVGFLAIGILIIYYVMRSAFFTKGFSERERNEVLKKLGLVTIMICMGMLVMEMVYDVVFLNTVLSGQSRPLFQALTDAIGTFFASVPSTNIPIPPTPTRKP